MAKQGKNEGDVRSEIVTEYQHSLLVIVRVLLKAILGTFILLLACEVFIYAKVFSY